MSTGDLISRGLADTNQLQFTLTNVANEIFKQPATLLSAIGRLVYLAFIRTTASGLVLLCLAIVPLAVFPIRYAGKNLIKRAQQMQAQIGSVTNHFSENLAAVREVRAFGLEQHEVDRFAESAVRSLFHVPDEDRQIRPGPDARHRVHLRRSGFRVTLVYAYHAPIPWNEFLSIVLALFIAYEPIKKIGAVNNDIQRGRAALDRLEEVLNEPVDTIADPAASRRRSAGCAAASPSPA